MIKNQIADGDGSGSKAQVKDKAIVVHPRTYPETDAPFIQEAYRAALTLEGEGVDEDMRVVGSAASPIIFAIYADPEVDTFIHRLTFLISDQGLDLSEFGSLAALVNGCVLGYVTGRETIINDSLQTNFDFVKLCDDTGTIFTNVVGASEATFPTLYVDRTFGMQDGIRLRAGTNDCIFLKVRDDTSLVDAFTCTVYGKRLIRS